MILLRLKLEASSDTNCNKSLQRRREVKKFGFSKKSKKEESFVFDIFINHFVQSISSLFFSLPSHVFEILSQAFLIVKVDEEFFFECFCCLMAEGGNIADGPWCFHTPAILCKESFINDVTQFWTLFDPLPSLPSFFY